MQATKEELKTPILIGYRTEDGFLAAWCPYCVNYHYHPGGKNKGDGDGPRSAHCTRKTSPFKSTGYIVKEANAEETLFKRGARKRLDRTIRKLNDESD